MENKKKLQKKTLFIWAEIIVKKCPFSFCSVLELITLVCLGDL